MAITAAGTAAAIPEPNRPGVAISGVAAAAATPVLTQLVPAPDPAILAAALAPELTRPHAGDSPATATLRAHLAGAALSVERAGESANQAAGAAAAAGVAATKARAEAVAAAADAANAAIAYQTSLDILGRTANAEYRSGVGDQLMGLVDLLTGSGAPELLHDAALMNQVVGSQAAEATELEAARNRLRTASAAAAIAQGAAESATKAAISASLAAETARRAAADSAVSVSALVRTASAGDQLAAMVSASVADAARAAAAGGGPAAVAAAAMRAQTLASGVASAADYAGATYPAAIISVASHAILRAAAGLAPTHPAKPVVKPAAGTKPAPAAKPAPVAKPAAVSPARLAARAGAPFTTTALMGPTPSLGGPVVGAGRAAGPYHSLEVFTGAPVGAGGAGSGNGLTPAPTQAANGTTVAPVIAGLGAAAQTRSEIAVDEALRQLGAVYVWGGGGPSVFDCSGLVQWAYAKAGLRLPHFAASQRGQAVTVRVDQMLPGDLVFFGPDAHHVGIYLGAGYMLSAPHTGAYVRVEYVAGFGGDFSSAGRL